MPLFRNKRNKIKYEPLVKETTKDDEVIFSDNFSVDAINLLVNNFVDPEDAEISETRKQSLKKLKSQSLASMENTKEFQIQHFKHTLSDVDARKLATFQRLKRRLENLKSFYPDVYHSDKSVIEMWARPNGLSRVNLELLDYDKDSPAWLWI